MHFSRKVQIVEAASVVKCSVQECEQAMVTIADKVKLSFFLSLHIFRIGLKALPGWWAVVLSTVGIIQSVNGNKANFGSDCQNF